MKKTMTIKELLEWAYNDELPKVSSGGGSVRLGGGSMWASLVALGTMVDAPVNTHGVISDMTATGDPDLAAVHLASAVEAFGNQSALGLGLLSPQLTAGWPDDMRVTGEQLAHRIAGEDINVSAMIANAAVLRRWPVWNNDQPTLRLMEVAGRPAWWLRKMADNGMGEKVAYWVSGWDAKAAKPLPGAVRRHELSRDAMAILRDRRDCLVMERALHILDAGVHMIVATADLQSRVARDLEIYNMMTGGTNRL